MEVKSYTWKVRAITMLYWLCWAKRQLKLIHALAWWTVSSFADCTQTMLWVILAKKLLNKG